MITSGQMRELEKRALAKDISLSELMERAGQGVFKAICERFDLAHKHIVFFCGVGNNGGDGLVAARYFCSHYPVLVLLFGDKDKMSDEAWENYEKIKKQVNVLNITSAEELSKFHFQPHLQLVLVDALIGLGIKGPLHEPFPAAIDFYNSLSGIKVSVDMPSGMHPDTGEVLGKSCVFDWVVTFHDIKAGLEKFAEKTQMVDIGLPRK